MVAPRGSKKRVVGRLRLHVEAGKATPAPPIGPALGQRQLNIMEFCKSFNDKTKGLEKGAPVPVDIVIYSDKSFVVLPKRPTVSHLIKQQAGLAKGSKAPGRSDSVPGRITWEQCREIAKIKRPDLSASDLEGAVRTIVGSARSMGVDVVGAGMGGDG